MMRFCRALAVVAAFVALALPPFAAIAQESAPAGAANSAPSPRPAIWLLADADTKIYLFGTIHLLPPGLAWRSAALERVIAESGELVLEIDADEMEAPDLDAFAAMTLGKTVPLEWRVSPERRGTLRAMLIDYGLTPESFDGTETWAAAMTISVAQLARAYTGEEDTATAMETVAGVEDALSEDFRRLERPISGVETIPEQMRFFSTLPFPTQRELLEQMIDAYAEEMAAEDVTDVSESADDMDAETAGWVSGDTEPLAAAMAEMPPVLFDTLLTRRNRAWTDWLIARLEQPGTTLFAVGAGHLAGRDSVQSMLAARGLTVTRVD